MKKKRLFQALYGSYLSWFLICSILLSSLGITFIYQFIEEDLVDTQTQLVSSLENNISYYFEELNDFSMQLMTSQDFIESAVVTLPYAYENNENLTIPLSVLYANAYGMIENSYRIGILIDEEYYIWMGESSEFSAVEQEDVYENLIRNETPTIYYVSTNAYLNQINAERYEAQSYMILARSMDNRNKYVDGRAVLEILVEIEDLEKSMQQIMKGVGESNIALHMYDSFGTPLYLETEMDLQRYVDLDEDGIYQEDNIEIIVSRVFDDNVTLVFTVDKSEYYNVISNFMMTALCIIFLVIAIVSIFTYRASKNISNPIYNLCNQVKEINLNDNLEWKAKSSNIEELDFLSTSIQEMSEQLYTSLDEIMKLKDYEVQAQMLALQAQMQPHFLFNTLSTIGSMADENGQQDISNICNNLTKMFRYIAADAPEGVYLFEELKHVEHYVAVMQERFPGSQIEIDVPLELYQLKVPKLILQPLVENSFKYVEDKIKCIILRGAINGDRWELRIIDNGQGFTRAKIEEINTKAEEALQKQHILQGKIDGMGLVNVYVRLKLFHGSKMEWELKENEGEILITGSLENEKF